MKLLKQLLRTLTLFSFGFVVVFFGYVLMVDFSTFRQEAPIPLSFVDDFPLAQAESLAVSEPVTLERALRHEDWRGYTRSAQSVLIKVAGDVAPVRVADLQLRKKGMTYGFSGINDLFQQDDLSLINLETPLIASCPERSEGMIFCGLPGFVGAMNDAGIELIGLANNHSGNYGLDGLKETVRHLDEGGLLSLEDGEALLTTFKEMVFGVVTLNGVTNKGIDRNRIGALLQRIAAQTDVLIVSVHWGAEYVTEPRAAAGVAPDDPRDLGRWFVDQGVDVVVGHHPHVVQGVELYKDGFIAYSHGNFIFDQEWSRETKEGVVGNYVFEDKKLADVFFTPVVIEDWVRPRFADEQEGKRILERMRQSSLALMKNEE